MTAYQLNWLTDHVAAGHAPMSYEQLDAIKLEGISAIINLCGEYCDLHEIEENHGFDVHYCPIPDECAPDTEALEEALTWMESAIQKGRKVLVHCRFGIGRTGTFLMAYFLRSGMTMREAEKKLKHSPASPAKFCQWKFLRTYSKQCVR